MAAAELAHWSFDGTYDEQSRAQRGEAVPAWDRAPVGGNINLAWDDSPATWGGSCAGFVRIGNPGYLEVPRVNFHNISFTFSFSIRLNGQMADRRILHADWSQDNWQFMSFLSTDRRFNIFMRNSKQEDVILLTSTSQIALGEWTDVAFNWDRSSRTASVYFNRQKAGSSTAPSNVAVLDLFQSKTYYFQFGSKADSSNRETKDYSPLQADVRNLRVFKGIILVGGESAAAKPALE